MAADLSRTANDDRTAALAALDNLERELPNLRALLGAELNPGTLWQAVRVARIVGASADDVAAHAAYAAGRAARGKTSLR